MKAFHGVARLAAVLAVIFVAAAPASAFVTFESGQVRPLAKSPDGSRLFVCNTPDARLEIFDIGVDGLTHVASVPVGLEPVAVAARTNTEVWVVNHLSDSVSIVDLSDIGAPQVTRTLTVGDEPRDIVFGGPAFDHAYITTAHRGQNNPNDPQLTTEGIGRADVWVFNANSLGSSFGGDEEAIVTLFGDTPRPLAVSPDGTRVYAGVFMSGNQTMTLGEGMVPNQTEANGGLPDPKTNYANIPQKEVGLIVKFNQGTGLWEDELGRDWSNKVKFSLPDYDVFALDATQNPPVQLGGASGHFAHVGTTLFNMAINPADGNLFVTNLEAFNDVRFEGPGVFADTTVRGHLVESRITVIDPVGLTVTPRHLNKHIDYNSPFDPTPNATNDKSLAFPLEMAFNAAGSTMYVAALGSSKIGVYTPSEIEADTFTPDVADQIQVTGGGPTGLVLDEAHSRLYVLTRFDNSVSVINTSLNFEADHIALHNPEPTSVVEGRPFLYDARFTSSRGDQACASCHIFGDFDSLAWDLGNPDEDVVNNPAPLILDLGDPDFHPMKGPMTTQSLRGMDNHGPMHWRGDRTAGNDEPNAQPNSGTYNEDGAFKKFNPAFVGLIGRSSTLTDPEMQKFTDFVLQVMYPPNPIRALDNSLTPAQAAGQTLFFDDVKIDSVTNCNGCHVTNRDGNRGDVERPGFFGSDGRGTFENETQIFKVAHLRNLYQKVGMFGMAAEPFINPGDNAGKGPQVRGFGFLHDGSNDTVFRFLQATVFNPAGPPNLPNRGFLSDTERANMEQFMLAFDSNHFPIMGQQATLTSTSGSDADNRVNLILNRADAGECDVVVKGVVAGEQRGWVYAGADLFTSDRASEGMIDEGALRTKADTAGQDLTFTAVPLGEGRRLGVDRDLDGYSDTSEADAASDAGDAASTPCATTEAVTFTKATLLDKKGKLQVKGDVTLTPAYASGAISVVATDSDGTIVYAELPANSTLPNTSGSTYKWKAPMGFTGMKQVVVKTTSTPNVYRVTVKLDHAWLPPGADETTTTTSVVLRVVDECFEGDALKVD